MSLAESCIVWPKTAHPYQFILHHFAQRKKTAEAKIDRHAKLKGNEAVCRDKATYSMEWAVNGEAMYRIKSINYCKLRFVLCAD